MLLWIIGFSLLGSVGTVAGAALMLLFPDGIRRTLVPYLVSYAAGTLLGAAFLGMIPAGLAQAPATTIMATVLAGIVLFFVLEKFVLWRHGHESGDAVESRAGPLILIGDAFHNFVDGVVIAAAFLTSMPLGVAAALAVIAHEVPQEVGDFAILLVTRTLSKAHSLAGFRVGCAVLPEVIADDLNDHNDAYPLARPSQAAAIATLQHEDSIRSRAATCLDRGSRCAAARPGRANLSDQDLFLPGRLRAPSRPAAGRSARNTGNPGQAFERSRSG